MVLPTLLFPESLLPLHIFEPRYREMLAWALEHDRMVCIGFLKSDVQNWQSTGEFHHVAGIGLIRASVQSPDGTANMVLQGLARVKLTRFEPGTPFPLATIQELPSTPAEAYEAEALSARLRELCKQLMDKVDGIPEALGEQLASIDDPSFLADAIAQSLLRDPAHQQDVFEELRVGERLRLLIRHLNAESL